MIAFDPMQAARAAKSAAPGRPATAIVHDSDDMRLVVFRIGPRESVPPHRSTSSVQLTVLSGTGTITGERDDGTREWECSPGEVIVFAPSEQHGMRANEETLVLLAAITPRPGTH
jgi:quercetin dioxygenase-like cupin family protein